MGLFDDDQHGRRGDDDSGRPNWRELDRRKDRSRHSKTEEPSEPRAPRGTKAAYLQKRASTQARSQAESLFSDPAREKAAIKIRKAQGDKIPEAVDAFREKYGDLPDDPEALLQALQHPSAEIQLEALEALDSALFDLEGPTREMTLRGVNLFRMSARDMGARKAAKRLLKAHGVDVPSY